MTSTAPPPRPRRKIIFDTDPGVDDILALLLLLSAQPSDVEILLISLTFGNIDVRNCLRNTVSLFRLLEKERAWRKANGLEAGFWGCDSRPLVAVGAEGPSHEQEMVLDYFFGHDGLANVHTTHPHFSPEEAWSDLFSHGTPPPPPTSLFKPSHIPAHELIRDLLLEHDADTITIMAVGPLTNLSILAESCPEILTRAKEVLVMGGAVHAPGNVTPHAEFNFNADPFAAAKVLALTNKCPAETWPPVPHNSREYSVPEFISSKAELRKTLDLKLFALDITCQHVLIQKKFQSIVSAWMEKESPLAEFLNAVLSSTFIKIHSEETVEVAPTYAIGEASVSLHDPVVVWYAITGGAGSWEIVHEDVRVETTGQWTRGMCCVDQRPRKRAAKGGNRVGVVKKSGWEEKFGNVLLARILGGEDQ